jgi:hypothetical protein
VIRKIKRLKIRRMINRMRKLINRIRKLSKIRKLRINRNNQKNVRRRIKINSLLLVLRDVLI